MNLNGGSTEEFQVKWVSSLSIVCVYSVCTALGLTVLSSEKKGGGFLLIDDHEVLSSSMTFDSSDLLQVPKL